MDFKVKMITVQEYAKQEEVTVQAVYGLVKRETLSSITYEGKKMIVLDIKQYVKDDSTHNKHDVENDSTPNKVDERYYKRQIKPYLMHIKHLEKEIKKLENEKDKNYERLENLFNKVIDVKQLSAPAPIESDVIEVSDKKKSKKSKKSNKKKGRK